TVLGEDHPVDVDYRLIETIERAFSIGAVDTLIPMLMKPEGVQRRFVADIVADTLGGRLATRPGSKVTRGDIREAVFELPVDDYTATVLQLLGAVAFTVKATTPEEFDKLVAGAAAMKKKHLPEAQAPQPVSPQTATSSQ